MGEHTYGDRAKRLPVGPIQQDGALAGVPTRVGAECQTDGSVHVELLDRHVVHRCNASPETARGLVRHVWTRTIRVHGSGRWQRTDGGWVLLRFDIRDFEVLDDAPLPDVVRRLHGVPGSHWADIDDPVAELLRIRRGV